MKLIKFLSFLFIFLSFNNFSFAKNPSALINDIVDEAALILSSQDPVESKIIRLNAQYEELSYKGMSEKNIYLSYNIGF